jgi:3'-phosphoadenosine 5'-phosphosulfate sulfotransferase (PAPS reductase)/FAD synthetase
MSRTWAPEPILSPEDHEIWGRWQRTAEAHAKTRAHQRAVDSALRLVDRCMQRTPKAAVSWSGGKDSTVMTHLVCVRYGAKIPVFTEKDDLDYPGEEAYVRRLGEAWGLDLRVLHPPISPREWIAQNASKMLACDDIHSRAAGLSKACFYNVMTEANRGYDAVMLGLRTEESAARRNLRSARGRHYELVDGTHRVLPIADWRGIDVFAYAFANGIELLPVYRCVAMMHADKPWAIRKSWWLPGSSAASGYIAWLRRYWPSLFHQLSEWIPSAGLMV